MITLQQTVLDSFLYQLEAFKKLQPASQEPAQRPIIPPLGDYQTLLSNQKAEVVYDITFRFVQTFLLKSDRTVDQMIQSARSGKQSILDGGKAATTSNETEIKLTNVGRASVLPSVGRRGLSAVNPILPDARTLPTAMLIFRTSSTCVARPAAL